MRDADLQRFWTKVDQSEGPDACWPFVSYIKPNGYGQFRTYEGLATRNHYPHRVAYEAAHGPIAAGLDVDHHCHNLATDCPGGDSCPHRRCCNPAHLRAVSRKVNLAAGRTPRYTNPRATHCKWGHEFTDENTYIRSDGGRMCRACNARRQRETQQRAKALK